MKLLTDKVISLQKIDFNSFSNSQGWLGYFERKTTFSVEKVEEAVNLFNGYFNKYSNFIIISALAYHSKRAEKDPEILSKYKEIFLSCIAKKLLISIKTDIGKTCNSSYEPFLPAVCLNLSSNYQDFIDLSKLLMSYSGIVGERCFYINTELNLVIYPHNDTGFGCIALDSGGEKIGIDFLNYCKKYSDFTVIIKKKIRKSKEIKELEKLEQKVYGLINKGHWFFYGGSLFPAIESYKTAWDLLPEPKSQWKKFSPLLTQFIYMNYFKLGEFEKVKYWAELSKSVCQSDTISYIYIGKAYFELDELDKAYQHFNQAYEIGKSRAFQEEPKKYWEFYKERKEKIEAEAKAKKKAKK